MAAIGERTCPICDATFVAENWHGRSKYCSIDCAREADRRRVRDSYRRHRAARIAGAIAYIDEHREAINARRRQQRHISAPIRLSNRARQLMAKYGLTLEQYDELEAAQGGRCAICTEPETRVAGDGTPMPLCVDHDHEIGQVRGLLCARCNAVLGWIESPGKLNAAQAYLLAARNAAKPRKVVSR